MSETETQQINLFRSLKENWIILGFLVQIVVTWTLFSANITEHDKRLVKLEEYRDAESIVLNDIQTRLASIETSLVFIKERLK